MAALWDALLPGALVEAEGVRALRKRLDQSYRLDPLIVPPHKGLDAACCSGKYNPGKTVLALPWFLCFSWAPSHQAFTFQQCRYWCLLAGRAVPGAGL